MDYFACGGSNDEGFDNFTENKVINAGGYRQLYLLFCKNEKFNIVVSHKHKLFRDLNFVVRKNSFSFKNLAKANERNCNSVLWEVHKHFSGALQEQEHLFHLFFPQFKLLDVDWFVNLHCCCLTPMFLPHTSCCITLGLNPLVFGLSEDKHLSQLGPSHAGTPHIIVVAQYRGAKESCQDEK